MSTSELHEFFLHTCMLLSAKIKSKKGDVIYEWGYEVRVHLELAQQNFLKKLSRVTWVTLLSYFVQTY